jgi:hypothetical protein
MWSSVTNTETVTCNRCQKGTANEAAYVERCQRPFAEIHLTAAPPVVIAVVIARGHRWSQRAKRMPPAK